MMKRILLFATLLVALATQAQRPALADLFRQMPDTLLPYLTANNRLDMVDFIEAGMKAEVTNQLDGKSQMTQLSADSLTLQLNDVLTVSMHLDSIRQAADSTAYLIRVARRYRISDTQQQCLEDVYDTLWQRLSSTLVSSSLLRRDEKVGLVP